VDGFRDFIGAPETQKFNIVLFGGEEIALCNTLTAENFVD